MSHTDSKQNAPSPTFGSPAGFAISMAIGFAFYALLSALVTQGSTLIPQLDYTNVITGITASLPRQLMWFLMDFTEPQFYASVFAGAGTIIGGAVAYLLACKNSRFQGFTVCYGEHRMFPWVLASQVLSLALTGFVIFIVLRELPWVTKQEISQNRGTLSPIEDVTTPLWFVRRVLAEFSEAPFYGNEVASLFIFAGLILGTILCPGHNVNGAGAALPAIVLSQFTSAAVGVLLYAGKFADGGWYATYVPVVSTGPAWAYLRIAEGCDNCCAYCVIPRLRGRYRSRPMNELLDEASELASAGVKELIVDTAIKNKLGARGLRGICERIFDDAMFEAPSSRKKTFVVTLDYAKEHLKDDI